MGSPTSEGECYRLAIRGELSDRFAFQFEGMEIERLQGTTVITGKVGDQAQLVGLIQQVQELGLELLSLDQISSAEGEPGSAHARVATSRHEHPPSDRVTDV